MSAPQDDRIATSTITSIANVFPRLDMTSTTLHMCGLATFMAGLIGK